MNSNGYPKFEMISNNPLFGGSKIGLYAAAQKLTEGSHLIYLIKYPQGWHAVLIKEIIIKDQTVTFKYMDPNFGGTSTFKIEPVTLLDGNLLVFSK